MNLPGIVTLMIAVSGTSLIERPRADTLPSDALSNCASFHGEAMSAVVRRLGRSQGIDIRLAHGVPDEPVYAVLCNASLESALQTLVAGGCLDYVVTSARHVLVTPSATGESKPLKPCPNVVTFPNCTEGYRQPRVLDLRVAGFQPIAR
jgi:hypothetical protein